LIAFKKSGTGPPLVLLHGFCETQEIWEFILPDLSKYYTCFVADLPGFGGSIDLGPGFSIVHVAEKMIGWVKTLGLVKPVILGHSLGGYVALEIENLDPGLSAGFGLVHSTAFADDAQKKSNRDKTIDFIKNHGMEPFIDAFVPSLFGKKDAQKQAWFYKMAGKTAINTAIEYTRAMRDRPDLSEILSKSGKKVLFLWGENDLILPSEIAVKHENLSKKILSIGIPVVGHLSMVEAPNKCSEGILRFLSQFL